MEVENAHFGDMTHLAGTYFFIDMSVGGRLYLYLSTMGYTSLSTQTRSLVTLGDFLSFVGLGNLSSEISSEISDTLPETHSWHLQHWGCSDEFPCGKAYFAGAMSVLRSRTGYRGSALKPSFLYNYYII